MQTESSELLDIVDDNDHVIGSATRGEIHARELKHRSIHVLVFDGSDSVLLQKRSMQKDQCGGMWDTSCAGHVESGQGYAETAPRELLEELGLTLPDVSGSGLTELFKMKPTKANGQEFATVYSTVHTGPFTAAEDEIDELRWFSFTEVDDWVQRISEKQVPASVSHDLSQNTVQDLAQDLTSGFAEIWSRFREPAA